MVILYSSDCLKWVFLQKLTSDFYPPLTKCFSNLELKALIVFVEIKQKLIKVYYCWIQYFVSLLLDSFYKWPTFQIHLHFNTYEYPKLNCTVCSSPHHSTTIYKFSAHWQLAILGISIMQKISASRFQIVVDRSVVAFFVSIFLS